MTRQRTQPPAPTASQGTSTPASDTMPFTVSTRASQPFVSPPWNPPGETVEAEPFWMSSTFSVESETWSVSALRWACRLSSWSWRWVSASSARTTSALEPA